MIDSHFGFAIFLDLFNSCFVSGSYIRANWPLWLLLSDSSAVHWAHVLLEPELRNSSFCCPPNSRPFLLCMVCNAGTGCWSGKRECMWGCAMSGWTSTEKRMKCYCHLVPFETPRWCCVGARVCVHFPSHCLLWRSLEWQSPSRRGDLLILVVVLRA